MKKYVWRRSSAGPRRSTIIIFISLFTKIRYCNTYFSLNVKSTVHLMITGTLCFTLKVLLQEADGTLHFLNVLED